jgi:magnesium-transporting ATPase (P-type)
MYTHTHTHRALCVVVYTGKDTKLSLNSKPPPSKLSVVDSVVNRTLIVAISAMIIVCVVSAIARCAMCYVRIMCTCA